MKEPKVGIIDPKTHELRHESESKARKRVNATLIKLDKELTNAIPVRPELAPSKTSYSDKELLDFLDTQLVKGMCWHPIWLDRNHTIVTVSRVDYAPIPYLTFRDGVAAALDLYKQNLKLVAKPITMKYII